MTRKSLIGYQASARYSFGDFFCGRGGSIFLLKRKMKVPGLDNLHQNSSFRLSFVLSDAGYSGLPRSAKTQPAHMKESVAPAVTQIDATPSRYDLTSRVEISNRWISSRS